MCHINKNIQQLTEKMNDENNGIHQDATKIVVRKMNDEERFAIRFPV